MVQTSVFPVPIISHMQATVPTQTEIKAKVSTPVQIPLYAKLAVGGIAGVMGTSIVFPLDLIKTRLQGSIQATNPFQIVTDIVRRDGIMGMYRGLKPNLIGVIPEKAIKLTINDVMREYFTSQNNVGTAGVVHSKLKLWQEVVAGAVAGFLQVSVTNPMEIIKLRVQMSSLSGQAASAGSVIRDLGFSGLYKGIGATWLRDVPFSFIFFPLYANLNEYFNGERTTMGGLFAAGALAGSLSAGIVTPFDVVKTRLQVVGSPYTSITHAFRTIYREEGLLAFKKGLEPRMIVQAPLFGITLMAFELQKQYLTKKQSL